MDLLNRLGCGSCLLSPLDVQNAAGRVFLIIIRCQNPCFPYRLFKSILNAATIIITHASGDLRMHPSGGCRWHSAGRAAGGSGVKKRPHNRPLGRMQARLSYGRKWHASRVKKRIGRRQRAPHNTWKTLASPHLPRRRHANRAQRFSLSKREQKKQQWSETGGPERTHLSLRHFTPELFFTECDKCGVKPESPREEFKLPRNAGSISEHLR